MTRRNIDWVEMIEQLEAQGVNICAEIHIDPSTLWRWKTRATKPSGDHAADLLRLQAGSMSSVAPMQ